MNRVLVAIGIFAAMAAPAAAGSLQDLIDTGTIEIGDFKFTFDANSYDPSNSGIAAKDITVDMIVSLPDVGFKFSPFLFDGTRLTSKAMTIGFKVESKLNPPGGIIEEELRMNSDIETGGTASIKGASLSVMNSTANKPGFPTTSIDEAKFSPPVPSITVKDALKVEIGNAGSASINFYSETFQVPEPPGLVLMTISLIGLVAAGLCRRRVAESGKGNGAAKGTERIDESYQPLSSIR
jgi:hypothetical protein